MKLYQAKAGPWLITTLLGIYMAAETALAGGNIEQWDITGFEPSPVAGHIIATSRGIRWDDRCIPVGFRVNATADPVSSNPSSPPIALVDAIRSFEDAVDTWNEVPTSYIEMAIIGETDNAAPIGFDFVNEVSFIPVPGLESFFAVSASIVLFADSELSDGDDLDLDGDSDVSSELTTCGDIDGDGDNEFPAGFYRAGSILENDVYFNPNSGWTVEDSDDPALVSLTGIATHEFGHSLGLAHSNINEVSSKNGRPATMFAGDNSAASRRAIQVLHSDDKAWSSFLYPEGSRRSGPGKLGKGDVRFDRKYAVVRGEVFDSEGQPLAGSLVTAEDYHGRIVSSALAGHVRGSVDPSSINPFFVAGVPLPPSQGIIDGKYELPVPRSIYKIKVEANDTYPAPLATTTGLFGFLYGFQDHAEEYYNGWREGSTENRLNAAWPIFAWRDRRNVDFVIDNNFAVPALSSIDAGIGVAALPDGLMLAVHVPRDDVLAHDNGYGVNIQAATFGTIPLDQINVAKYDSAMITTGQKYADGTVTVDVAHPLVHKAPFIGQDADMTPLYPRSSRALGRYAATTMANYDQDFFLVLQIPPDEFPGAPGIASAGIIGDILQPTDTVFGQSYLSTDGGATWTSEFPGFEYAFQLIVAPRVAPDSWRGKIPASR